MRRLLDLGASFVAGVAAAELARAIAHHIQGAANDQRSAPSLAASAQDDASPVNLDEAGQSDRGRDADRPGEIPARGWKDILVRTYKEFGDDQIPLIAAGCTFYTLLALFPGVTAFAALYGLFADVGEARTHVEALSGVLPAGAISLIGEQMIKVAAAGNGGLSLTFVIGLATAF